MAAHPTETKYHRIRLNNKVFKERVVSCIGGLEALRAAGFALETEGEGEGAEQVLRLPESRAQALAAEVEAVMAALESAEPVVGQLDRAVRLFRPSAAGVNPARIEIPTDFYTITSDDIRTLHSQLQTEREREQTLRTQAMRDAERSKRIYHYTLLRIRFPDGIILQGGLPVFSRTLLLGQTRSFDENTPSLIRCAPSRPLKEHSGLERRLGTWRCLYRRISLRRQPPPRLRW